MAKSTEYLGELSHTDLLRVSVALATEVYELRDRLSALEEILTASGVNLAALDEPVEPAAYDAARASRRDAYVARVFAAMRD